VLVLGKSPVQFLNLLALLINLLTLLMRMRLQAEEFGPIAKLLPH
jgi:hypothetical protein